MFLCCKNVFITKSFFALVKKTKKARQKIVLFCRALIKIKV